MNELNRTRIFADTADIEVIRGLIEEGVPLDGVTTNPSLLKKAFEGRSFSEEELNQAYINLLKEIRVLLPEGSISGEIYVTEESTKDEILNKAREMSKQVEDLHIKIPITIEGLKAANEAVKEGISVNMTLCFSREQAMAVEMATQEAIDNDSVYVSPFVGRLNDIGIRGMSLIEAIATDFSIQKAHTQLLAASIRTMDQFQECLRAGIDIVTVPVEVLMQWKKIDFKIFEDIDKGEIQIEEDFTKYNTAHQLTTKGIEQFVQATKDLLTK